MADTLNVSSSNTSVASSRERMPVTFDRLIGMRTPTDPALSPDGQRVAFVVAARLPEQAMPGRRIWTVNTTGGEPEPLNGGSYDEWSPCWSPDSKRLAFISLEGRSDQRGGRDNC